MNHNNYRTIDVTLTTRLPIAFGWLVGDAEWAMGIARGAHGAELGEFFHSDREADGGLPHVQGHPHSTQPRATGTACPAASRPAAATRHVWQCGNGQDDGQRYPARRLILLPPENHRDHHHPPAPIPRQDSN